MFIPLLGKGMDYLHRVLPKSNQPDQMIKEPEKKPATAIRNPDTGLEVKKNIISKCMDLVYTDIFISVPYVPGLSKEFRRIFWHASVQIIFKGAHILKSIIMHPNDKIPSQLKQNIIYKWSCAEENCSLSYVGESSRCLEK